MGGPRAGGGGGGGGGLVGSMARYRRLVPLCRGGHVANLVVDSESVRGWREAGVQSEHCGQLRSSCRGNDRFLQLRLPLRSSTDRQPQPAFVAGQPTNPTLASYLKSCTSAHCAGSVDIASSLAQAPIQNSCCVALLCVCRSTLHAKSLRVPVTAPEKPSAALLSSHPGLLSPRTTRIVCINAASPVCAHPSRNHNTALPAF